MEKSHFINMGVEELLHELLTNENVRFNMLDIENHIRINTNNYEIARIEQLYYVLWGFMFKNANMKYKGKTYNLPRLDRAYYNGEQLDDINFNDYSVWDKEIGDGFDDIFDDDEPDDDPDNLSEDDETEDDETNNISEGLELTRMFMTARNLSHMNKGMFFEYEQGLERVENYVGLFAHVFIRYGVKLSWSIEDLNRGSKYAVKRARRERPPLTFEGLFNAEYLDKIGDLTILLRKNKIITETDELLLKGIDFARIYYYLIKLNVIKNDFTNRNDGIKAFFARFKVDVVEKIDDTTSQVARPGITNEYARIYDLISDDYILKELEKLFL